MPAWSLSCGVSALMSWSPRMTVPDDGRRPIKASHSSVCPLPCTPATPRISPALTSKEIPSTADRPVSPGTTRSRTASRTSPGRAASLLTLSCTLRPTMSEASSASVHSGPRSPTTLPCRITVILSAMAWTSLSLCEMKTMERPSARRSRMMRKRSSVSPGVSTAVGSSRIRTLASRISALMISTRCWMPTGSSSTTASGSTSRPNCWDRFRTSDRARRRSSRPRRRVGSWPRVTFSATVNTGTSMKCWCTMPIRAAMASLGERIETGLPSTRISPSSG